MISPDYKAQVRLLLMVLPYVAEEAVFALKGGTAINLFHRDFPRLSVDIDLTYLPTEHRKTALQGIANGLSRIKKPWRKISRGDPMIPDPMIPLDLLNILWTHNIILMIPFL